MFKKTFFFVAPSYHGTTLVSKLLNAHPEVCSLADTYPTNEFDQGCGCGQKVSECSYWQAVRDQVDTTRFEGSRFMLPIYPWTRDSWTRRLAFSDFTSFWATPKQLTRVVNQTQLAAFRTDYETFLDAIAAAQPESEQTFVDGVKSLSRISTLQAAGFPMDGLIHIRRRASDFVASSYKSTKRDGTLGLIEHSLRYRMYHRHASRLANDTPHLNISYEALGEDTDGELARVFRFMGVTPMGLEELRPHFDRVWHFVGNKSVYAFDGQIRPSRHQTGTLEKRLIRLFSGRNKP